VVPPSHLSSTALSRGLSSTRPHLQYSSGAIMPNLNNPLNNDDIDILLYDLTDEEMDLLATRMAIKEIS
jgi:hypothetical protein